MSTLDQVRNNLYDWCDLVLNGATVTIVKDNGAPGTLNGSRILPASLVIPIVRSHHNEGTLEGKHIVIGYTPDKDKQCGLDLMELGVSTDYDFDTPDVEATYATDTHISENETWVEIREVNGSGGLLNILRMTLQHPVVQTFFRSKSMAVRGFEGGILSVPYKTGNSYHEESMMVVYLGRNENITFNQDFIAGISGNYYGLSALGATIISGTYTTDQE